MCTSGTSYLRGTWSSLELQRRQWHRVLTKLLEKQIDVALVKEFYSNIYEPEDRAPKYCKVWGISPGSMRRPLMISWTPRSLLLMEKTIWWTPNTCTRTRITKPLCQSYAYLEEDLSWMPTGPLGSYYGRISLGSLRHGAYFLILTLPLLLILLISMSTGQGLYTG